MSLSWGPMSEAINKSVEQVTKGLSAVESASSSMKLEKTAKLQWDMAVMQQVMNASSNVTQGCLSAAKNAIGNMNH